MDAPHFPKSIDVQPSLSIIEEPYHHDGFTGRVLYEHSPGSPWYRWTERIKFGKFAVWRKERRPPNKLDPLGLHAKFVTQALVYLYEQDGVQMVDGIWEAEAGRNTDTFLSFAREYMEYLSEWVAPYVSRFEYTRQQSEYQAEQERRRALRKQIREYTTDGFFDRGQETMNRIVQMLGQEFIARHIEGEDFPEAQVLTPEFSIHLRLTPRRGKQTWVRSAVE